MVLYERAVADCFGLRSHTQNHEPDGVADTLGLAMREGAGCPYGRGGLPYLLWGRLVANMPLNKVFNRFKGKVDNET